jgi:hypothetical protein
MGPSPSRTREWAASFRLGFGKYRGRLIGEVAKSVAGRRWLCWMIDTVDEKYAAAAIEAARIVERDDTGPPCPRCGSSTTREVRLTFGPHHAELLRGDYGRRHRFPPHPAIR